MTSHEIHFRVPAGRCKDGQPYGTYLSSMRVIAESRADAIAQIAKAHPEYTELH
ncbi:hypothetical protein [Burkholderia gladioli]|uniref:hypothetical protein n=1 Tax=Burkholderia gladioli TaxID=28095 RepID=UPI001641AC55|nr:hypothetical protein [Burkholderia gladioli]